MQKAAIVLGLSLLALTVSVASPCAAQTVTVEKKKVDPKQVEALVQQGMDALSVGDAKAARDSFSDSAQLDPRNIRAQHGLAIAYFKLGDFTKSGLAIDKAVVVPGAVDYAMAYNAGVIQIQNKSPMRAAKITREYLAAKPGLVSEQMANLLGRALELADPQAQKNNFYIETKAFYDKYIKRLEAANPGYMRWGPEWLPADEVKAKLKSNAELTPQVKDLSKEVADLERKLADGRKNLAAIEAKIAKLQADPWTADPVRQEVVQMESTLVEKKAVYNDTVTKLVAPEPLADVSAIVAMDAPAAVYNPGTAVAINEPKPVDRMNVKSPTPPKLGKAEASVPPKPEKEKPAPKPHNPPKEAVTEAPPEPPVNPEPPPKRIIRLTSYAAAFPVAADLVVTSAVAVEGSQDITLQARDGAVLTGTVVRKDDATGLALVRVKGQTLTFLDLAEPQAGKITCAAYPEVNIFTPAGELLPGTAIPPAAGWTIRFTKHPRLAGAPLIQNGKVVGVVMATRDSELAAVPAVTVGAIKSLLAQDAPPAPGLNPDPAVVLLHLSAIKERTQE